MVAPITEATAVPNNAPTLRQATAALAYACDGARTLDDRGFNKMDKDFGRQMAMIPEDRWSPRQAFAIHKMLRKYRVQLLGMGINYDQIVVPTDPGPREVIRDGASLSIADRPTRVLGLKWPYKHQHHDDLYVYAKVRLNGRWNKEEKTWFVTLSPRTIDTMKHLLELDYIEVAPDVRDFIRETIHVWEQNIHASHAAEGDLEHIEGVSPDLAPFPFQRAGIAYAMDKRSVLFADEMGLGKFHPVDTKVSTPDGWRQIGTLAIGDLVHGSDGLPARVVGVYPQGERPTYRVSFSDGSSVEAGDEHLWTVRYRRGGRHWTDLVLTTNQLRLRPMIGTLDLGKTTLYLPMLSGPLQFSSHQRLPVDPYLLGALIANGTCQSSTPQLTYSVNDIDEVRQWLPGTSHPKSYDDSAARVSFPGGAALLRPLGLRVGSADKHIPLMYQTSAPEDRISLLQGLMDADGSISKRHNKVTYHTTSDRLAKDVVSLVESLGGIASVRTYDRTPEGKPVEYHVRLRLPEWVTPFRLTRKAERYLPGSHARPTRTVRSVEYTRSANSVCIAVDTPDQLYVTERCIVTHNTPQSILTVQAKNAYPVLVISPSSLKLNWKREWERWVPGTRVAIASGRKPPPSFPEAFLKSADVLIINYDVLDAWVDTLKLIPWNAIIADEAHYCFPFEAIVQTDRGPLPIGEIVEGRIPVNVVAYNSSSNALEWKPVTGWWRNERHERWVRVHHERGSFVCTEGHKVWTEDWIYKEAKSLTRDDYLRVLPDAVRDVGQAGAPVLREFVRGEVAHGATGSIRAIEISAAQSCRVDSWIETTGRCRAYAHEQSDAGSRVAGEDAPVVAGTHVPVSGRKWDADQTADHSRSGARRLADGVRDLYGSGGRRLPVPPASLQGGHRGPEPDAGNRSRWPHAYDGQMEAARQEEGARLECARVVRVEVLEHGSGPRSGGGDREGQIVYDLEVADHHNYVCDGVVVSNCKSYKSKRTKAAMALFRHVGPAKIRLLLTGTPILNEPLEIWTLLQMIGLDKPFGNWRNFSDAYGWGSTDQLASLNLTLRAEGMVRRRKVDVLKELPPLSWSTVPFELAPKDRRAYDDAEADLGEYVAAMKADNTEVKQQYRQMAAKEADDLGIEAKGRKAWIDARLEQLWSDYYHSEAENVRRNEAMLRWNYLRQLAVDFKLDSCIRFIEEMVATGEKVIVFGWHQKVTHRIADHFKAPTIVGGMKAQNIEDGKRRFMEDPDCKVIVLNIAAGGVGHTLTASSNVVFVEFGWNPAAMDQAAGRSHRIGQTEAVTAWLLTADDTIDADFIHMVRNKRTVVDAGTDGAGEEASTNTMAEIGSMIEARVARKKAARA